MYNRDYSKEVGLDTGERIVPWRYLVPFVALVAALCWIGATALARHETGSHAATKDHHAAASHS